MSFFFLIFNLVCYGFLSLRHYYKWRNVLKMICNKPVNFVNLIPKLFCSLLVKSYHYIANGWEFVYNVKPSNFPARLNEIIGFQETVCNETKSLINDQFRKLDSLIIWSLKQVPKYLKVAEGMKCLFLLNL